VSARLTEIVVDCANPERLAEFWCEVLGWEVVDREGDGSVEIGGPAGGPTLLLEPVPDRKQGKNRIHLDVNPTDRDQAAEVERIIGLGATHVDIGQHDDPDANWVVLADPEGNEFCVLHTRVDP
jgi:catechol 2,3-dioxygenase-like lactoylglutathione lyase family enzyme